jgi:hypothetical protein
MSDEEIPPWCGESHPHFSHPGCEGVSDDEWCWHHNRSEPTPEGGAYRICGECFHCFNTEADLLAADRTMRTEVGLSGVAVSGDDVLYCPLCSHDF